MATSGCNAQGISPSACTPRPSDTQRASTLAAGTSPGRATSKLMRGTARYSKRAHRNPCNKISALTAMHRVRVIPLACMLTVLRGHSWGNSRACWPRILVSANRHAPRQGHTPGVHVNGPSRAQPSSTDDAAKTSCFSEKRKQGQF